MISNEDDFLSQERKKENTNFRKHEGSELVDKTKVNFSSHFMTKNTSSTNFFMMSKLLINGSEMKVRKIMKHIFNFNESFETWRSDLSVLA
ncbi:CLUMA_CG016867, isoform A [Clunio marinus]|uniref:CLUMA_CG016867, isoform A n=1 Tax=Clunio marinus TaxID=568069 RepID=A0A1J1IT54_9DIPT|nr:CLUMA_CG016867, isoform A [Clunio marinus]